MIGINFPNFFFTRWISNIANKEFLEIVTNKGNTERELLANNNCREFVLVDLFSGKYIDEFCKTKSELILECTIYQWPQYFINHYNSLFIIW